MQDARTVPVAAPGVAVRAGWLVLLALVCLMLAVPLGALTGWDPDELWDAGTRALTLTAAAFVLLLMALTARTVFRLPGATNRRELVVGAEGMDVVEHPKWWHRGGRARVGWDDVQVVNAPGPGELLELYLTRDVPSLPAFAAAEVAVEADTSIEGVRIPAPRLRFGEPVSRDVAEAVAAWRPDLFYAGTGVDQWFTPPQAAGPRPVALPRPDRPAAATSPEPPEVPRPAGPVWLDHGEPWPRLLLAILAQVAVLAGGVYLMNDPFGLPTVAAGLVALVLLVPVLFCCLTLPVTLWLLPRATAGVGILVSADGLQIVRKRRWRPRALERSTVGWDWVQAAVTRRAFDAVPSRAGRRRVVDLYLHENPPLPVPLPGVGADAAASEHTGPDAVGTGRLVGYPATRLRLTYRHDLEPRGRDAWPGNGSPVRMPAHQLRPALLAFRPQLCHGFDDLWEGTG